MSSPSGAGGPGRSRHAETTPIPTSEAAPPATAVNPRPPDPTARRRPAGPLRVLADGALYVRHPRATTERALRERDLGDAVAVTASAIVLTALPFATVPAPGRPPRVPRAIALGLTWLGGHRPVLLAAVLVALLTVTAAGYGGTCLLVRRWRPPGSATDWRRLLVGIGYVNALSTLSALIAIPAVALQAWSVGAWEAVNAVTGPLSLLVGALTAPPAWFAVRRAGRLTRGRAALALALPAGAAVALVAAGTVAALELAFRGG